MGKINPLNAVSANIKPYIDVNLTTRRVPIDIFDKLPWSAVGLIQITSGNDSVFGSGFMCQSDVFLTASHNFTTLGPIDSAGIWLAYDQNKNPSLPYSLHRPIFHPDLDLAVVILAECNVNPILLGGSGISTEVTLGGYGYQNQDGSMSLTISNGKVTSNDGSTLNYAINTQPGDSGAPVLTVNNNGEYQAAAVHMKSIGVMATSNAGTLITPEVIQDINEMIALARKNS